MKSIRFIIPLAVLLALATSCKKDADMVPEERPFPREFYVEGVLRDYDNSDKPFEITVGTQEDEQYSNLYTNKSAGSLGAYKAIKSEFYGIHSSQPHFSFIFRQETPAASGAAETWTKAELDAFFTPGKVCKIDGTPGNAQIRHLVEMPDFYYLKDYAIGDGSDVNDELTITAVEDYSYQLLNVFNGLITLSGKKVSCTFSASVQRPVRIVDEQPEYTSARIENGKATFFVRAQ